MRRSVIALLFLLLAGKASATVQGYWRGEATPGRLKDSSFYSHSLTMNGTVPNPTSPTALDGVKILYQGTGSNSDNLRIPAAAFNYAVTGELSFYDLVMAHDAAGDAPLFSILPSTGSALDIWIRNDGKLLAGFNSVTYTSTSSVLTDGAWHLIKMTINPLGTKLYIDGTLQINNTDTPLLGTTAPVIYLGKASSLTSTAKGGTYQDAVQLGDSSTDIYNGPVLPLPTSTVTPSVTKTITVTSTPTFTKTITSTSTITKTTTNSPTPTFTSTVTLTFTLTPTWTPTVFQFESLGKKIESVNALGTPGPLPVISTGSDGTPWPTPAPQFTQIPNGTPIPVQPVSSDGSSKVYSNVQPGITPTVWFIAAPAYAFAGNVSPSTGANWITNIPYAIENDSTFTSMTYAASTFASGNTGASASAVFLTLSSRCKTVFYNSGTTTVNVLFSNSATAPTDTTLHYEAALAANGGIYTVDQSMPFCHFWSPIPVASGNGNIHISHKIADTRTGTTYSQ